MQFVLNANVLVKQLNMLVIMYVHIHIIYYVCYALVSGECYVCITQYNGKDIISKERSVIP